MTILRSFALAVLLMFLASSFVLAQTPLSERLYDAVGLLYSENAEGTMNMRCTVTAFEKTPTGYLFVTAAHCVGDDDHDHEKVASAPDLDFFITLDSPHNKTFYNATLQAVGYQSRGDDFAIFAVDTRDTIAVIPLGDEKLEHVDAPVVNVASPLGLGKQTFHGTITMLNLDRPVVALESNINWRNTLVLSIPVGGGSSGSAIVSVTQERIVGFLVGTVGGNFVVAIPVSRFDAFRTAIAAHAYKWEQ